MKDLCFKWLFNLQNIILFVTFVWYDMLLYILMSSKA